MAMIFEQILTFLGRRVEVFLASAELGVIYTILALGVFISFRTLNTPDLTVDGSFVLGAAVSAVFAISGYPVLGLVFAFVAGAIAGSVTSLLNTKLGVQPLLAGILVMLGLYSINLRVMSKPNVSLINSNTIYSIFKIDSFGKASKTFISIVILAVILVFLLFFLKTRFGFVLRATGDNEHMVRASGVNTDFTKLVGLAVSNGLVGLSGAMIAQIQKYADINMGTGMVVIGLASVIIGEVVFGTKSLFRRLMAVALGSILYRYIIGEAYEMRMPTVDLKLVSAIIVALALSAPKIGSGISKIRARFKTGDNGGDSRA